MWERKALFHDSSQIIFSQKNNEIIESENDAS